MDYENYYCYSNRNDCSEGVKSTGPKLVAFELTTKANIYTLYG